MKCDKCGSTMEKSVPQPWYAVKVFDETTKRKEAYNCTNPECDYTALIIYERKDNVEEPSQYAWPRCEECGGLLEKLAKGRYKCGVCSIL